MNRAATSSWVLTALMMAALACTPKQSVEKTAAEPAIVEPQQLPPVPEPKEVNEPAALEPELLEGSGKTAWAENFEGQLIAGLDGGLYDPYRPTAVEFTQRALRDRGLYSGPVNGLLDLPTMKAIYEFQKANHNLLQVCGVPTPRTRSLLMQGSHTDPAPTDNITPGKLQKTSGAGI